MTNQMSVFSQANLPSVSTLASSLKELSNISSSGWVAILKMDKTGHWVFGADQTEVEPGSKWAVNPFSFIHGFIAWGDGVVLGEKMEHINNPLPDPGAVPAGAARGWESQVGVSLKCVDGEDEGLEVRYTTNSVGGKKAVQQLAIAIAGQVALDQTKPVPIVTLEKEHYAHKKFGRIYTPVFAVAKWIGMDGDAATQSDDTPAIEEAPAAGRRRRAA